jgi:hypothetical protein
MKKRNIPNQNVSLNDPARAPIFRSTAISKIISSECPLIDKIKKLSLIKPFIKDGDSKSEMRHKPFVNKNRGFDDSK